MPFLREDHEGEEDREECVEEDEDLKHLERKPNTVVMTMTSVCCSERYL